MAQRKTTDLHVKILEKDWSGVKNLVSVNPDLMIYKDEKCGKTPLSYALDLSPAPPKGILMLLANKTPNDFLDDQDDDGCTALFKASFKDIRTIVRYLINARASLNIVQKDGWSALTAASSSGHDEVVRCLLHAHARLDIANHEKGNTALHLASLHGQLKCVKLLIESTSDLNVQNNYGWTALFSASLRGHHEVVNCLIDAQASLNITSNDGWSPVMAASSNGHHKVVHSLIAAGSSLDIVNDVGNTALHLASQNGQLKCAEILIESTSDLNFQNHKGWTALLMSSLKGHQNIVRCLIDARASLDIVSKDCWTALMSASSNGHHNVVRCLIDAGASVDIANTIGNKALHLASQNGHLKCVKILMESTTDLNVQNYNGWTSLFTASFKGHHHVVRCFIEAKVPLDTLNKEGLSTLMTASANGYHEVVQSLLVAKASLKFTDKNGNTALHLTCENGQLKCAKLLIESTSDLNVQNKNGATALHIASSYGHADIVELLLTSGANDRIQTRDGSCALHCCFLHAENTYKQHHSVCVLLLAYNKHLALIKNQNGMSPIQLYEQHKCEFYKEDNRNEEKKTLIKILTDSEHDQGQYQLGNLPMASLAETKCGQVHHLGGQCVPQATALSKKEFRCLLIKISAWYECKGYTNMLKVLYNGIIKSPNSVQNSKTPMDLFKCLETIGTLEPANIRVLIDTITVTRTNGILNSVDRLREIYYKTEVISFSTIRQKLITFGKQLLPGDMVKVGDLYSQSGYNDKWDLILLLEKNEYIKEDKIYDFVNDLKSIDLHSEAKTFEDHE